MIKCEVKICAVISRAATMKNVNDSSFISFGVTLPVTGRDGSRKDLDISVSLDGDKSRAHVFSSGRRVELEGTLTVRKHDGKTYYNLRCTKADLAKSTGDDHIDGTMLFRGKISKKGVEEKKDKKDAMYKVFSAFSTDKDGDKVEFTWVRFLYFNPKGDEMFLQGGAYVEISGSLQLGVYRDDISLDCRVSDIKPWVLEH